MTFSLYARQIKLQQQAWASEAGIAFDKAGYCATPEANLPWLTSSTRREFDAADGNEFGHARTRAKIAALHSSSALAVNFFGYWRSRDASPLGQALGMSEDISDIRFEQKFLTGVGPRSPNLDVILRTRPGGLVAIESKFSESFGSHAKAGIQDKYVASSRKRWSDRGLPGAQAAVEAIRDGATFSLLDAPQLLKHMLGLAGCESDWSLLLLWYAPTPEVEAIMRGEANRFAELLGSDSARFRSRTYQSLWQAAHPLLGEQHSEYAQYITRRYFRAPVA